MLLDSKEDAEQIAELQEKIEIYYQQLFDINDKGEYGVFQLAGLVKNIKSDIEQIDHHARYIRELKARRLDMLERIKNAMHFTMEKLGSQKLKNTYHTVYFQKPASKFNVELEDIEQVPDEYKVVKVELNKSQLQKDLKDGEVDASEITGVQITPNDKMSLVIR